MFKRLGTWCHDRRRLVLVVWLVLLVGGGVLANRVGSEFRDEFNPPDSDSSRGFEVLEGHFDGLGAGVKGTIVIQAPQGVDDPEVREAMQPFFAAVAEIDGVISVSDPYVERFGQRPQVSAVGEHAGRIAFAEVEMPDGSDFNRAGGIRGQIRALEPDVEGVDVELGGFIFGEFEEPSSEILGLAFAIVILIVAFGSVLAMGLPIGVALFGIGVGTTLVTLLSQVLPVPDFASMLGIMIGLGVGIDYALLIVTRFREQVHHGHDVRESVGIALDTAGRSVLFAGTTVVISLLGMLLMGVAFVQGLAVAAASVVAVTVVSSLTLLPALIGFAGHRVEVTRWRGLLAAGFAAVALVGVGLGLTPLTLGLPVAAVVLVAGFFVPALRREVPRRPPRPLRETLAFRWSRVIQRNPWPFTLGAAALLVLLAVPVLSLRLGFSDEGNSAPETSTRRAYDLLADGFGPGFNGPILLAAQLSEGAGAEEAALVGEAIRADAGVALLSEPFGNGPDPSSSLEGADAVLWQLMPTSAPQDEATDALVDRLRGDVLPPVEEAAGFEVHVTGMSAATIDFTAYLASRLPYFFGAVLLLSFLLLLVVFRSLLVPLKAVIMNLLSIGAAYGIVVALFQWGWLSSLTGVQPAPIEPWAPMMLFAIVFGLSMDYEVFLLSRVREEWLRTGDSRTSVADGLAATARVITAAAAIMVFVFGSFVLEADRVLKLMGTGLAVAIFLDATVVRMLLVPATMELLGDRNWWLPRWLDRILPNIDVEGHADHAPVDEPSEAESAPGLVSDDEEERVPTGID